MLCYLDPTQYNNIIHYGIFTSLQHYFLASPFNFLIMLFFISYCLLVTNINTPKPIFQTCGKTIFRQNKQLAPKQLGLHQCLICTFECGFLVDLGINDNTENIEPTTSSSRKSTQILQLSRKITDENNIKGRTSSGIAHPLLVQMHEHVSAIIKTRSEGQDQEYIDIPSVSDNEATGAAPSGSESEDTPMENTANYKGKKKPNNQYDDDGLFKDLEHIAPPEKHKGKANKIADVNAFFNNPFEQTRTNGKTVKVHDCIRCKSKRVSGYTLVKNNFISMIAEDVIACKAEEKKAAAQTTLDGHVQTEGPCERVTPYSKKSFRLAAIQWLIKTDQCMVDVAACAKDGITIPTWKVTQKEIIHLFGKYLDDLAHCLNASNINGYFAVTGHWIEEKSLNEWSLESALLGDNASNNVTMMAELSKQIKKAYNLDYDPESHRIGCFVHIINLATQALLKAQSKSPYYDPTKPDTHMPDTQWHAEHDEVGLICAISVKVQWSSMYMMLNQAYAMCNHVQHFLTEISRDAKDNKTGYVLYALIPSPEEWQNVKLFQQILEFKPGLQAGLDKIVEYYDKTSDNDAYVFSIVLEPTKQLMHFKTNWTTDLLEDATELCKTVITMTQQQPYQMQEKAQLVQSGHVHLLWSPFYPVTPRTIVLLSLWQQLRYIDLDEDIPEDMTTVKCERAFSSVGITVTKRCNRLKGDIVEALQALKCAFRCDLFFKETSPSSATENELKAEDSDDSDIGGALLTEKECTVIGLTIDLDSDAEEDK
ncbi:hypothetical protein POSPLADRAFT_1046059 [Postia placenta MAD-698-R-SB12]|uniref:HAT C-terminal dimerisation domain-containing protein n=1 Tax=Postia placenta MAD-698-R-SB12 TaxID=670580 RepID=A0A1X6N1W0_9APHY|nr:hypothetical protein POSPLADRAFT_1046059 [Postia placenta MAD-698-R-SB12]OSX62609.1 hypothetical protein POSPLADRAFT_1046059 [Postia placenta MAD-698-R-SB12]